MSRGPAFRLRPREPLGAAVERIVRQEIDGILHHLEGRLPDADAVHEIRKSTKRLRALVRLVRDQLGERCFHRENRAFRDAARMLSSSRDAAVVAGTIGRIAERRAKGHAAALKPFRAAARERLQAARDGHRGRRVNRVIAAMRSAHARVERWSVPDDGWKALRAGFRRIYRKSRDAWRAAAREPSDERLHEWRKRVKDLRYVLELLEPVRPKVVRGLADEVDDLADRLGDDHDLALLRRFVLDPLAVRDGADPEPVLEDIDAARDHLQVRAWPLADRVFETKPRRLARHVGTWWRAWSAEVSPDAR